jgi:decaprenylphospho-beta-D-ribofuranose 2-oxidase
VLRATIRLKHVDSSFFVVDTDRTHDLAELLDVLATGDDAYEYSVAWFDTATRGERLGRAVVTRGDGAGLDVLTDEQVTRALELSDRRLATVPFTMPDGLVNRWSAAAFNALWYAKAPAHRVGEVQDVTQFFHPLDVIADWNRVYGPRGFCQYQFVVPFGAEQAFTDAVTRIADSSHVSSLNVLKRFGPGNPSPMSFPLPGWTLAVDLPVRPGLDRLLDDLDALVADAGGRLYLAKDSRMSAAMLHRTYPRVGELVAARDEVDPHRLLDSDLSRRLQL